MSWCRFLTDVDTPFDRRREQQCQAQRPSAETSTAIAELTGAGAHLTVDAVGSAATALAAVSGLRRGGQHVQVGLMLDADALAPLPWKLLVAREFRVAGSHGMSAADYPAMLAMITDGRLDLGELSRNTFRSRRRARR